MRTWRALLVLACLAAVAAGQDAVAKPDTPEQVVDKVLVTVAANDATALKALAGRDDPDPWLVADDLCARGALVAADAFARAAPRKAVERLPDYVAALRANPTEPRRREALRDLSEALDANDTQRALTLAEEAASAARDVIAVRHAHMRGSAYEAAHRRAEAWATFRDAADAAERLGWLARQAQILGDAGICAFTDGRVADASAAFEQELAIFKACGIRRGIAMALTHVSRTRETLGDYPGALEALEAALPLLEEAGEKTAVAATLGYVAGIHAELGDCARALAWEERAFALREALGDPTGIAIGLANLGRIRRSLGDYPAAMDLLNRALKRFEQIGKKEFIAATLANLGGVLSDQRDPRAMETSERALRMYEDIGDKAGVAATLVAIGMIREDLGDYPGALADETRGLRLLEAIGDRARVAAALVNMGSIHKSLGDYRRALECQERALKLNEDLGDRIGAAQTLANIGDLHERVGDPARALEIHQRVLKLAEEIGDKKRVAAQLVSIGNAYKSLGDYARALEHQERALKLEQEIGDRAEAMYVLGNIAGIYGDLHDYARALEYAERGLAASSEAGDRRMEVQNLWAVAAVHLMAGRPAEAVGHARQAVTLLPSLVRGLADEQGAMAREYWATLFDVGAWGAAALGDCSEVAFFLESGRAGSLLESLEGRGALHSRAVPEELQAAEREARMREAAVFRTYQHALDGGVREEIRAKRAALDEAQAGLVDVVAQIQRDAKAGSLLYGRIDSLDQIRGRVREGEALVLYGKLMALVVTREAARIIVLDDLD
ncbi:MAG: tetratricopeptide repeat protein, partial [Planctomycetota bacterium]